MNITCETALKALMEQRWLEWSGLPKGCTLQDLDRLLGGSTVLDTHAELGTQGTPCTRSSMNDAPLIAWHDGPRILRIEHDLITAPVKAPRSDTAAFDKLDITWGLSVIHHGEWVLAGRGLALVVTSNQRVVSTAGFEPTDLDQYIAALRPRQRLSLPPEPSHGDRGTP